MYTDSNVPIAMAPLVYNLVATTEKPHCGMMPTAEPISGLSLPRSMEDDIFDEVLCSKISISTYTPAKNGSSLRESISASKSASSTNKTSSAKCKLIYSNIFVARNQ